MSKEPSIEELQKEVKQLSRSNERLAHIAYHNNTDYGSEESLLGKATQENKKLRDQLTQANAEIKRLECIVIVGLECQITQANAEIERLKNKLQFNTYESDVQDMAVDKVKSLTQTLRKVREEVKGFGFGEHICCEKEYPGRCQECETNRDVDAIVRIIDKELDK